MADAVTSQSPIGVFKDTLSIAKTSGNITFEGTRVSENSNAVIDPAQNAERNANNYFAKLENHTPSIDTTT